jgi:Zn-dependent protease
MGGIGLPGGAVYIETWRLRGKGWESAVSLAGPFSNLILAILLAVILNFAPPSASGIWPGLGFLALLQISAVVLNLLPVPPFDGYGALAPFLNYELRVKIARAGTFITLGVFVILWNVAFVNDAFWSAVFWLGNLLHLPFDLVLQGYTQFRFWERLGGG